LFRIAHAAERFWTDGPKLIWYVEGTHQLALAQGRTGEEGADRGLGEESKAVKPRRYARQEREGSMFLLLFIVLAVAWLLGWGAFHVAGGLIHLLLIVALICLIVHFVRGRPARA